LGRERRKLKRVSKIMDATIEYKALKVFEGKKFIQRYGYLPSNWYKKHLMEFLSEMEIEEVIKDFISRNFLEIKDSNQMVKLNKTGKDYLDKTYLKEQAYDLIDNALKKLISSNGKDSIDTSHRNQRIQQTAEKILDDYELVKYALPHEKLLSMVEIIENGYKVIEAGGIRNYLRQKEEEEQRLKPSVKSVDDFLKKEVDEITVSSLKIDYAVATIIEKRIIEVKQCIKAEAPLAVIFLCGSILEGILLGVATKNPQEFNQSSQSPKDKTTQKVKPFPEWSLNNFIDVAYNVGYLGLDVKKHSHSLRDFRNYIHPYEQMKTGFNPDLHTAKISWQVLKAAIHDIYERVK